MVVWYYNTHILNGKHKEKGDVMKSTYKPKAAYSAQIEVPKVLASNLVGYINSNITRLQTVVDATGDGIKSKVNEVIERIVYGASKYYDLTNSNRKLINLPQAAKTIYTNSDNKKANLIVVASLGSSSKKKHSLVTVKFYIIDDNYTIVGGSNKQVVLNSNSVIYQVSNDNTFNVFEVDGKYYKLNVSGATPVKVSIISGDYISHDFGKIDVIDNSNILKQKELITINMGQRKTGINLKSDDGEYISTNEKNIAAGEYQTLDEKKNIQNINVDYIDLSKLNKSLSGKIMTIEMLGKKYYQVI